MAHRMHEQTRVVGRRARGFGSSRSLGFTLIEMMVVVILISILSVLAVVGYRTLIQSSHVSEALNMVQNIRVAQEEYHSETQTYANVSTSLTTYYPQAAPVGNTVTGWGAPCGGACNTGMDWSVLPVHVDGPVMFGYATVAGPAGSTPTPSSITVNGQAVTFPSPSQVDWFVVAASCDIDNAGTPNTHVYTTSWQSPVMVDSEGN